MQTNLLIIINKKQIKEQCAAIMKEFSKALNISNMEEDNEYRLHVQNRSLFYIFFSYMAIVSYT
jgi:hypothetical protein